jgi:hypothetical protein
LQRAATLLSLIVIGACLQDVAQAQPAPLQTSPAEQPTLAGVPDLGIVEVRSATWPLALGVHALIGVEPHDRGNPVAFGGGAELLWRGRFGGFAALLASEGSPVIPPTSGTGTELALVDRISVPFGFATRPLATIGLKRRDYWGRLLTGIGLQAGITVEHYRLSTDEQTTAGLHLGAGVDVPLWGGTREGGVALRIYGRFIATPSITFIGPPPPGMLTGGSPIAFEPAASGQFFVGVTYYP